MSVFQSLRRAFPIKGPKSHGTGFQSGHTPVHSTRPFRHVPVIQKHYRGDPQLRKDEDAPRIDRDIKELEGDLLAIKMRLKGLGYRDSDVLNQLEAMYGASRETLWALNDVKRKLNEERERKKAGVGDKEGLRLCNLTCLIIPLQNSRQLSIAAANSRSQPQTII
ncbi:uncharacterized protein FOBCDRAFT_209485 [Fusarium oxysporum Fo47]|uniref:uncharacterized protein n=1 Tax=Fusarium oxysporum Fo47 TaxID=660027 RepID=UPI002869EBEB|nr:uncharacterized protein FOBCDRAFT_209485 [Fusarium oxysporum Fo47]QKD62804.2 hypothetical protein FOBCDRAFT_209485 [Fusarium oxysporum Fo47]